jgi:5-methylcytosine-specific restriction endonuclease McrA
MPKKPRSPDSKKLDDIVATAQRNRASREQDYRERSLKMYPWVCGRCSREFTRENLQELTVHHRDHNHDNNPEDGSNWELLCLYCHDNEHARYLDGESRVNTDGAGGNSATVTHNPLAALGALLKKE